MAAVSSAYAKSIVLPCDQIFRNLKNAKRFAIDIGGSLAKLAYCSSVTKRTALLSASDDECGGPNGSRSTSIYNVTEAECEGIRLHFIKFETKYIEECLDFIRNQTHPASALRTIKATGGGAHKYSQLITEKLSLQVEQEDEMECLIKGCNFLLKNIPDESFAYHHHDLTGSKYHFQTVDPCSVYPYLLVNIGSGVSIVKVNGEGKFERVGGTSMGGGTFWGLGSLLTEAKGFDDLLQLAEEGDHRNVDMLVHDIYGGSYEKLGLPGDLIASSFGKTVRHTQDVVKAKSEPHFEETDVARSLLLTISNSIGQIAYLYAQLNGLNRIYFGGYFIRGHPMTMRTISYAINYWSKGQVAALFLRHEGYLGAVGAFLKGAEEDSKISGGDAIADVVLNNTSLYSWSERYAGSSGLLNPIPAAFLSKSNSNAVIHLLEMDCSEKNLTSCPLLKSPSLYQPDTVDLTQDTEAREYWLKCFEEGIVKTVKMAVKSQSNYADAEERAKNFEHSYIQHLKWLRKQPFAYGCLNVRSLLDLNEQLLNEYYFPDAYLQQKQEENDLALKFLVKRLNFLQSLTFDQRQLELAKGFLAGNVFDWGAKEVVNLMEAADGLSFSEAQQKLEPRPWLCDDFEAWLRRLKEDKPHKCATIFVDNSGFDCVLGVIPFAWEMLSRGTKVILCSNSRPALNDVTHGELMFLMRRIGKLFPPIEAAQANGDLILMENGQGSPCLDLNRIDGNLATKMREFGVDLIVLEGMGRALHTNFYAEFACESLKVAVIKNLWLAQRLGGGMFSVIFKYERSAPNSLSES